ncbi:MAG: hypothetical protein H7095_00220 [Pseudopedobacter sp.]|nr:hypothetical protein [Deinococcales bacterium]
MQIAAWIMVALIVCSSSGLFYAGLGPLRKSSSARFILLFAAIQMVLALVLVWVTVARG